MARLVVGVRDAQGMHTVRARVLSIAGGLPGGVEVDAQPSQGGSYRGVGVVGSGGRGDDRGVGHLRHGAKQAGLAGGEALGKEHDHRTEPFHHLHRAVAGRSRGGTGQLLFVAELLLEGGGDLPVDPHYIAGSE
ncbi:MAG: hypothetical protein F4018_19720 [Acidobacteria bacterium]|nr:hypothetical protein [Acidobacteriota bacterium]